MSRRLWTRVVVMVAVLAVPLTLAMASQQLAARPDRPAVPDQPVQLSDGSSAPAGGGRSTAPPVSEGPLVVTPAPPGLDQGADEDDDVDGGVGEDADG